MCISGANFFNVLNEFSIDSWFWSKEPKYFGSLKRYAFSNSTNSFSEIIVMLSLFANIWYFNGLILLLKKADEQGLLLDEKEMKKYGLNI